MAIKDLIENTRVNEAFLIKSITSGVTTAGSQYYSITFQDKTGAIDGKLWDAKNSAVDETWAGKIVSVTGDVIKYRNALQIKVLEVDLINDGDISLDNFVMTAKEPLSDLKATIDTTIASFENKIIKDKGIDFVIVREYFDNIDYHLIIPNLNDNYDLLKKQTQLYEGMEFTYFLYQKKG